MTFSKAFVSEKLDSLAGYAGELAELLKLSDEKISNVSGNLHIAERLFQLIVDIMLDLNQHFIRELKLKVPEDFQSTFYMLGENNVLPKTFAQKIAPIVGVRNRLVHQYEKLDKELFLKNLRKNFSDFELYQNHIKTFLSSQIV